MDKKSLLGLLLIGIILFGFTWYTGRQQKKYQEERARLDSIARLNTVRSAQDTLSFRPDTLSTTDFSEEGKANALAANLGEMLVAAQNGEEKNFTLSNDVMQIDFSSLGGKIDNVTLKEYKRYNGGALEMFRPGSERFDMRFFIKRNFHDAEINTGSYHFVCDLPADTAWREGEKSKSVSMKLYMDSTAYLEYLYTIYRDQYMIDFDVRFVDMQNLLSNQTDFTFEWENVSQKNEKGFDNENNYTTISYHFPGEKSIEDLGMAKAGGTKSEDISSRVQWIAFKQQFFSSVMIADDDFQNALLNYYTYQPGQELIKKFQAQLSVPFVPNQSEYGFQFYFGPNKYSILDQYDIGLERLVPLGWGIVGWVNRWFVIPVFDFLNRFIGNFGWIILILTILVKVIISPLTYKSYLSSAKMRLIKPEVDELNAKYPKQEDAMKKQQAMMDLYKRAGINPMSGCIPMLIQFPILVAMFRFFPASIELRGERFLWADDLSSYDSILNLPFNIPWYGNHVSLFALLMAAALFVYSWINFKQNAAAQPQMAGMKFMMLYLMPILMLLWFNNYASGLCYYYFLSNLITIGQMYLIRYFVDDEKLHQQMLENAKKPKKKSKFQERYEAALKQQQEMQRRQAKSRR